MRHTICVIIYEWFLILKIFELDFVNFDSDNDKNPRKMSKPMSVQAGIHKPLDLGIFTVLESQILKSDFYLGWIP